MSKHFANISLQDRVRLSLRPMTDNDKRRYYTTELPQGNGDSITRNPDTGRIDTPDCRTNAGIEITVVRQYGHGLKLNKTRRSEVRRAHTMYYGPGRTW